MKVFTSSQNFAFAISLSGSGQVDSSPESEISGSAAPPHEQHKVGRTARRDGGAWSAAALGIARTSTATIPAVTKSGSIILKRVDMPAT